MEELFFYWYETLERDLKGFADPHTNVAVEPDNGILTCNWMSRGRERNAIFRLSPEGDFRWHPDGDAGNTVPYRQFLVSEEMADFGQLSSAIASAFKAEQNYIPTKATKEGNAEPEISDDLLFSEVDTVMAAAAGKTRLLFVKGDAGAGKSTLLRQVTGEQARRYQNGDLSCLFMYISAQGRALSNLRDAIAGELDDLRAGFTRDAVPALVRNGLLVPIVDGFDELLGAAGYGDAFGSLQQFLSQLRGQGVVIVSARSAFYDVEFVGRQTVESLEGAQYDVEPVSLSPWDNEDLHHYLALARGLNAVGDKDRGALDALQAPDLELLSKPFFASLFPQYVDADDVGDRTLLEYLVDAYVVRESGKIVDRDGNRLLPVKTHKRLFIEATEAMWSYESRDLSEDDLKTLAELVAESSGVPSDTAKQYVTKITSYHGFQTTKNGGQRRFRFEHEVYFDYFLSQALGDKLGHPTSMTAFLDNGLIPNEVVRSTVDAKNADACLELPSTLHSQGVLQENRRSNLGSLVAAAFASKHEVSDVELSNLSFVNVSFGQVHLNHVRFRDCRFRNVGLDKCHMESCEFYDSYADRITVSQSTRLDLAGIAPGVNLRSIHDLDGEETYVPSEMVEVLRRLGAPGLEPQPPEYSAKALAVVDLLHRVIQKYRRTNLLCLEDDTLGRLFQDSAWPTLHELIVEHGIVQEESRQTSGKSKMFLRPKIGMPNLLRYETTLNDDLPTDALGNFWRAIRAL